MNLPPKQYIVYWMSEFNGKKPGYTTPVFKPNAMSFDTPERASAFQEKMTALSQSGGLYRGRVVRHVSNVSSN